jgi:predicted RNA binding protein YcfA (HicA-like mRNA interferase family)
MAKLPVVSGLDLIKLLIRKGFVWTNTSGSHVTLVKQGNPKILVTVPLHKELKPGLLNSILKKTNTSRDEL